MICKPFGFNSRYLICVINFFRDYPCLCLCLGFSHITLITPFLFITLHLSHIGFTDALTFIIFPPLFVRGHIFTLGLSTRIRYIPSPCELVIPCPLTLIIYFWVNLLYTFLFCSPSDSSSS